MSLTGRRSLPLALAAAAFSAISSLAVPAGANAQDVAGTPENIGKRIAIAGRQRMLAEGMAKSVCYAQAGIDAEENLGDLYTMWNLYGWYHRGIYLGNVQLDLFQEKNERIKQVWTSVDSVWASLSRVHHEVLSGGMLSGGEFERMIDATDGMTELNSDMVAVIGTVYAREMHDAGQGSAHLIDLYERQRMLAQKLSKEVCLVQQGFQLDDTRASLNETMAAFDASIGAFIDGMPSVSVPPAPTGEIRTQLIRAKAHWDNVRDRSARVAEGGGLSREELSEFRVEMNAFIGEMTLAISKLVKYEASKA